ncbi:MAG: hypothetical protein IJ391_05830 [Clostridia bacterium]|nr:hypothetical protein [Clostridia bacterium]
MKTKTKSTLICALLMTVSLVAMRYGRDEDYIPAESYGESAREVFFMFDESEVPVSAISYYSANNILSASGGDTYSFVVGDEYIASDVLPPVITPPDDIEVFGESGD